MDWNEFAVDAKAVVKSGAIKKKKEFKNVPLKKLYNYIKRKRLVMYITIKISLVLVKMGGVILINLCIHY